MDRMLWIPNFTLRNPDSMHTLDSSPGCFLVLRKLFLVRFFPLGFVLFSVFSILCITSLMWWLPRPQHQETKDSLSVKPGFQIPNFSEIPNSLSWILNSKALDSGSHQQNFTWVDFHNMAMQLSSWYPLQYSVVPLQKSRPETRHDTLAASIAFFGSVILGNAYIAPATSLHLTFSTELRTSVVIFAFFL